MLMAGHFSVPLPITIYTDPDLLSFQMKKYFKFRLKHPQYSVDLFPSKERAAFDQNLITILPNRASNGERILVIEIGSKYSNTFVNRYHFYSMVNFIFKDIYDII